MTQGKAYPAELRARVLAAILAGASITAAARAHGVDKRIVSKWTQQDATLATLRNHDHNPETLVAAIVELTLAHVAAMRAQLEAVSDREYVLAQPAGGVAELLETEADSLIRLLAGFRPREEEPL